MTKYFNNTSIVAALFCLVLISSCSSNDDGGNSPEPADIIPSNISMTIVIVGSDASNPDGNGSGRVNVEVTATDAVRYGVKFGNDEIINSSNGIVSHTFTQSGTNNHLITVFAYSSTDNSISAFETVSVFVDSSGYNLIWSDEFNTSGAPDASKWTYDTGAGGWGNGEEQYYTDRSQNVIVEDGMLKIIAKRESFGGAAYTSARLKTQNIFDFTYGKVEVRAKLPNATGSWPAIWMLGSNIDSVSWPRCGEIDIMEQTGWDKTRVLGTCHWFNEADSSNASFGENTSITNASSTFHIYTLEWTSSAIKISVDDNEYYEIATNSSMPFDNDFFMILNVALGGTLGGTIDSGFSQDMMEIDYVRVYQ